ncbi:hypothetical protein SELSPUOL_01332 [Selenomonas sputigena ATCC 35185]|uniref:DUF721 domain-containing protein n=2 Tax=Selenomonas sputigena (strain ATCC 35185 / DSM 20758 / CCUG 44933 / VPI D19B-28) TaxID=546271 RepID=C9LV42_SELS3|nr:hypothetical protein SELSPUOL_01332 [Selenomonas sputigena ATCC 35185]
MEVFPYSIRKNPYFGEGQTMKRSYRRNPGMEKINQVIPKSIHALGKKIERTYQERFVLARWPEIVGEGIASHVQPIGIEGEKLLLHASVPAWRNEITLMQMTILARFNTFAGFEMVKELAFSWKKGDIVLFQASGRVQEEADEQEAYRKALREMTLTEEEQEACERSVSLVSEERLRKKLRHISQRRKKREKALLSLGEKPCPQCGKLFSGEGVCPSCTCRERRERRRSVRRHLLDLPWARYADIKDHLRCTPAMVASERTRLVQELARRIEFGDWESLEAKTLVMLYRSLRPEQLTEDVVRRTLYDLRREMAEGTVFRPFPKRSEVMKKTAKRGAKSGEGFHVSAPRR